MSGTRLSRTAEERTKLAAHMDDEVAVLRSGDVEPIKASQLNFQVSNVAKQLTLNRCATAV